MSRIKILLSIMLMVAVSAQAYAAPTVSSVSGTVSQGQSITISGSNFGAKSTAAPLKYDDFSDGTVGNSVYWEAGTGDDAVSYSNTVTRGVHSKVAKCDFSSGYSANLCLNATSYPVLYMDWWVYVTKIDNATRNYKIFRLYGNSSDMPQLTATSQCGDSFHLLVGDNSLGELSAGYQGYLEGQWQHWQVAMQESTANTSDGVYLTWVNGTKVGDETIATRSSSSMHFNQIRIGSYWAHDIAGCASVGNSGGYVYVSSAYVDTTWARIEIGDASTYDACTHREIQVPSAWSASSITATVNQGSFSNAATGYVYVVASDGTVNATGKQITFGGTDTTAPTLVSATIDAAGTSLSLLFSETVSIGAGGNGGVAGTLLIQGAIAGTYASGDDSNTLVYTIDKRALKTETGTIDYTQPGNGIEDAAGNDLVTLSDFTITNNSTQMPSITITGPTTSSYYSTSNPTVTLTGTATGDDLALVQWHISSESYGNGTGTSSWTCADIPLTVGTNTIYVFAYDQMSNPGQDVIIVTLTTGGATSTSISGCVVSGVEIQ